MVVFSPSVGELHRLDADLYNRPSWPICRIHRWSSPRLVLMPIADRDAALAILTTFLDLLTQDRDDCNAQEDRTALDTIYRYIDAVRSIALAVDVVQFHRIRSDDDDRWDTARVAVLRVIGQLEHADDMAKILIDDPPDASREEHNSNDDEPF